MYLQHHIRTWNAEFQTALPSSPLMRGRCCPEEGRGTVTNDSAGFVVCMVNRPYLKIFDPPVTFVYTSTMPEDFKLYDSDSSILNLCKSNCFISPWFTVCEPHAVATAFPNFNPKLRAKSTNSVLRHKYIWFVNAIIIIVPHRYTTEVWILDLTPTRSDFLRTIRRAPN